MRDSSKEVGLRFKDLLTICVLSLTALPARGEEMSAARIEAAALAPITDQISFDRASREAILAYARALIEREEGPMEERAKVGKFLDRSWRELLDNYRRALATCSTCESVNTTGELRDLAARSRTMPGREAFYRTYLAEQSRLASLFPKVTSEIDVFNDNEITGSAFSDMTFLWTFDDGPGGRGGHTDRLIEVMNHAGLHGIFFALGERLDARRKAGDDLVGLYENQCLGSHGETHRSHAKWPEWQTSVTDSLAKAKSAAPASYVTAFRPPYGQRTADSGGFFRRHGIELVLWNIDSQDWQKQIDAQSAADRVIALMLLRRKGIILFHDIHPKARTAVPLIVQALKATQVKWMDCRHLPKANGAL